MKDESSIYRKGKPSRFEIRPEIRRSLQLYLYTHIARCEAAVESMKDPATGRTEKGRENHSAYYEHAAAYLRGILPTVEHSQSVKEVLAAGTQMLIEEGTLQLAAGESGPGTPGGNGRGHR